MQFCGAQAHRNRPQKTMACPTSTFIIEAGVYSNWSCWEAMVMYLTNAIWRKLILFVVAAGSAAWAQQTPVGAMAQLAAGGGQWTTTFTLINTGTAAADITLNFFDDNGNALTLPVFFPETSTSATGASFVATIDA